MAAENTSGAPGGQEENQNLADLIAIGLDLAKQFKSLFLLFSCDPRFAKLLQRLALLADAALLPDGIQADKKGLEFLMGQSPRTVDRILAKKTKRDRRAAKTAKRERAKPIDERLFRTEDISSPPASR